MSNISKWMIKLQNQKQHTFPLNRTNNAIPPCPFLFTSVLSNKRLRTPDYSHSNTHFISAPLPMVEVCLSLIPCCVGVMGTLWQLSFCCDLTGSQISCGVLIVRIRCACMCMKVHTFSMWKWLNTESDVFLLEDPSRFNNMPLHIHMCNSRFRLTTGQNMTHWEADVTQGISSEKGWIKVETGGSWIIFLPKLYALFL